VSRSSDFLPSELVPVVRLNPDTHQREMVHLRWGLIPSWADDPTIGDRLTHARSETVATKRAFQDAFRQRRCLLVTDGIEMGQRRIEMKDGRPFGMGGAWERREGGEPVETCAVITTPANELVEPINNRMPVIIAEEDYDSWLNPEFCDDDELVRMMEPFPADGMVVVRACGV
jgi:putative SOS response-associated peptidase YedK